MKKIRIPGAIALVVLTSGLAACANGVEEETEASSDPLRSAVVRLYAAPSFGGKLTSMSPGDYDLAALGWDDRARSLRVFGSYEVVVFENPGFTGGSATYDGNAPALGSLDAKVSSIRIRTKGTTPPATPEDAGTPPPLAAPPPTGGPMGWAAAPGAGLSTTTGGAGGPVATVDTLAELAALASDATSRIIQISGTVKGSVNVGSNKTIIGLSGAAFQGHLELKGSVNVIVQNLRIVGYDCSDASKCQDGSDAVTITKSSHHVWFDHCAISDGSDGNLDVTHAADFITVSWTKFFYSRARPGGHQFSNLIGHRDDNPDDTGHLRVTFHHDWWADRVSERMPRVRYGQVHVFDNLFTAAGNNYCIRAGVEASVLAENNVFLDVNDPFDIAEGNVLSRNNLFSGTSGNSNGTGKAFSPPYGYALEPVTSVEATVKAGAGPR